MPKAHITTISGSKITIEGTSDDVAKLVKRLDATPVSRASQSRGPKVKVRSKNKEKSTPINLISSLIDGGFFRKPKDLAAVKVALEEMGHFFPVTTLSPSLLRLVRRRQLRRIKDQKRWLYTG